MGHAQCCLFHGSRRKLRHWEMAPSRATCGTTVRIVPQRPRWSRARPRPRGSFQARDARSAGLAHGAVRYASTRHSWPSPALRRSWQARRRQRRHSPSGACGGSRSASIGSSARGGASACRKAAKTPGRCVAACWHDGSCRAAAQSQMHRDAEIYVWWRLEMTDDPGKTQNCHPPAPSVDAVSIGHGVC